MRKWTRLFLVAICLFAARPAAAVTQCAELSMTVTAAVSTDPGFEGLYKYTITGTWDVTQFGLSHIDFFLTLKDLECVCDSRIVKFPVPGGTSTGVPAPCTVLYEGEYNCKGDPSVPSELNAPTIKFNAVAGSCAPGVTGSGTWVFYSPFAPGPYSVDPEGSAIKHGQGVCVGELAGTMPLGDCSTPANTTSWGNMKALYR